MVRFMERQSSPFSICTSILDELLEELARHHTAALIDRNLTVSPAVKNGANDVVVQQKTVIEG